ncbi:MAG: N-acetylmuramic acid 6-phosphate etherase [Clostridiales bacterium]|jgi:N-acetylmuramic acid 6-phosphate etherase|nr:N-acetylmuramic acid 6-phosphate etherase [Clostridiales bacterium]
MDLSRIDTERANPRTADIDKASTLGILALMNEQDHLVAEAVRKELPSIARAVDLIHEKLAAGGRLVYIGSGTSGRLGVLDAVECPPTFGVEDGLVLGLIAGGPGAFVKAREGAEDDRLAGAMDLKVIGLTQKDALVGIAASGRTPYVLGAMAYAKELGAAVIGLACTRQPQLAEFAEVMITLLPGPEVITGSTRLKSGTATKMALNMLSTAVMIKLGKVYGNLMVDVKATNDKLRQRAVNILTAVTGVSQEEAKAALSLAGGNCKTAIVVVKRGVSMAAAEAMLQAAGGHLSKALGEE